MAAKKKTKTEPKVGEKVKGKGIYKGKGMYINK